MNSTSRSKARYDRAAGVLPKITLDDETEAARQSIVSATCESTSELLRRLLREEAKRVKRRMSRAFNEFMG